MLLPIVRGKLSRGATCGLQLFSCPGWRSSSCGQLGAGGVRDAAVRHRWTSAYATIQAAAQLVCPSWVRALSVDLPVGAEWRADAWIVRLGWVGGRSACTGRSWWPPRGLILTILARYARIESITVIPMPPKPSRAGPEAPAPS